MTLVLTVAAGCSHAIRGGPASSLNAEPTKATPEGLTKAGQELLNADNDTDRNKVLKQYVMLIDQRYAVYIEDLRHDRTMMDLATGLAGLAIGVAGTLTDGVAAKTNYAAAGTLLAGGSAVVNQSLYYEQTIVALVSAMDANRAEARLVLANGMEQSIEQYSSDDAYKDLIDYERAGTLLAAIGYIQATSKAAESKADLGIKAIVPLTLDQRKQRACSSRSLNKINANRTAANLLAAANALGIGIDTADKNDAEKIADKIRAANRDSGGDTQTVYNALKTAGVINCPTN